MGPVKDRCDDAPGEREYKKRKDSREAEVNIQIRAHTSSFSTTQPTHKQRNEKGDGKVR
jgi:hypothetical protein